MMKPAECWEEHDFNGKDHSRAEVVELIKQIQQDALQAGWGQGMESAEAIANEFADYDIYRDGRRIAHSIRDSLNRSQSETNE